MEQPSRCEFVQSSTGNISLLVEGRGHFSDEKVYNFTVRPEDNYFALSENGAVISEQKFESTMDLFSKLEDRGQIFLGEIEKIGDPASIELKAIAYKMEYEDLNEGSVK